ncbi:hypothetical protein [Nonomuraea gerenzanensis]|uniref:Thiazolylpeptide-type bacteriocin n=1 Tax=Nonomuraea gerenzanensis TaxID=93944 RepID=A0A1M4EFA8_9ACTN|nr:hypothetical protein [Nonomuraea gerenzanensis]UBU09014.1 hypothetical protein LCN96_32085 [Nonomuraea gerenzanensis]SBO97396.1 hypothetical protein BN4615_P6912 [Nonomuraea gerenzanensis]
MQILDDKTEVRSDQTTDDVFDLVIGDLELEIPPLSSPTSSGTGTACGSCATFYCC